MLVLTRHEARPFDQNYDHEDAETIIRDVSSSNGFEIFCASFY